MAYSIDASSDSCYEGTTCLINKLGIRDEALLARTESAYVLANASYLELHPLPGEFDLVHYQSIHLERPSGRFSFVLRRSIWELPHLGGTVSPAGSQRTGSSGRWLSHSAVSLTRPSCLNSFPRAYCEKSLAA